MPYFLSQNKLSLNKEVEISGDEAGHILLSHRVKIGEKIKLQDPSANRFLAEVTAVKKKTLTVKIVEALPVPAEPSVPLVLFQAVVSEKALDFIFQKSTELGVSKIVLFNSKNTAVKLDGEMFKKKQQRWNKILTEAAKQSERAAIPVLEFVDGVAEVKSLVKNIDAVYFTDVGGGKLSGIKQESKALGLIVGPEGGFSEDEVSMFKQLSNVTIMSLGPILLRAETAALAGTAVLRNLSRE